MKFTTTLLLLSLLLPASLCAQATFAPVGAHWNYNYMSHSGDLWSDYMVRVSAETPIANGVEKTLELVEIVTQALPPQQFYEAEGYFGTLTYRNDSVFLRDCLVGTNGYLFSWDMQVGDTLHMEAPAPYLHAVVDSIDSVLVGNLTRTRWHLTKYCDTTFISPLTIIEDIGPVDDFIAFNHEGCWLGTGAWGFNCYYSTYLNINPPCPLLVRTGLQDRLDIAVEVAPQPADGLARLSHLPDGPWTVQVLDLHGRPMRTHQGSGAAFELDTQSLPAGTYILQLHATPGVATRRLVILH